MIPGKKIPGNPWEKTSYKNYIYYLNTTRKMGTSETATILSIQYLPSLEMTHFRTK